MWGSAVSSGVWLRNHALKEIRFAEKKVRYVRLLATARGPDSWSSAAEITPITTLNSTCVKTIQINVDAIIHYTFVNGT